MTTRAHLVLPALLLLAALLALTVGPDGVSPRLLADALAGTDPAASIILLDIRLPRILAAALVGAAPGLCGAEIGRASCRERVCQYVFVSVVAVSLQKKKTNKQNK